MTTARAKHLHVGVLVETEDTWGRNIVESICRFGQKEKWTILIAPRDGLGKADPHPARQLVEICAIDGIRIPDEVAILAGDDDELLCNVATPQISSIELASHRIGETAAKTLKRLMDGAPVPLGIRSITPLRIRARQSTNLLAIDDPDLAKILQYIRDHAKDGIGVRDVARACCLSRRTLEKRFQERLGRTPGEEIRRARFDHVRLLLLDTNKSIAAIAFESGFASGALLCQSFQKLFGETPGQYRRSR